MSNIAYASMKLSTQAPVLNPFWQQLSQKASAISMYSDTLSVSLLGTTTDEWGGLVTALPINLERAAISCQVSPGEAATSSSGVWAGLQLSTSTPQFSDPTDTSFSPFIRYAVDQGNLVLSEITTGGTTVISSGTYDPVNHRFLRLADSGSSTIHADYSADGVTWTLAIGTSLSSNSPYYAELLTYSTSSAVSTASFGSCLLGPELQNPTSSDTTSTIGISMPITVVSDATPAPAVVVTAVVLNSSNGVVTTVPPVMMSFNYGDSVELIQSYATDAVRKAVGDYSITVNFI
jgi:hypothetical protein